MEYVCKKVKFATNADADFYIKKLGATSSRKKIPTRAYFCRHCNAWHLTSQQNKEVEELNNTIINLRNELAAAKQENEILRRKNNKEENITIKTDQRILTLNRAVTKHQQLIKKLRKSHSELITKLVQYQKNEISPNKI